MAEVEPVPTVESLSLVLSYGPNGAGVRTSTLLYTSSEQPAVLEDHRRFPSMAAAGQWMETVMWTWLHSGRIGLHAFLISQPLSITDTGA